MGLFLEPIFDVLQIAVSGFHVLVQLFPDANLHFGGRLNQSHLDFSLNKNGKASLVFVVSPMTDQELNDQGQTRLILKQR